MKMEKTIDTISKIYSILNNHNLNWFIDSGSLLGVIREGTFLKWDRGVDISIIVDDTLLTEVESAVNEISKVGFYCARYTWKGKTFKFVFTTKNEKRCFYNIDLHLFVQNSEEYVCPQFFFKPCTNFFEELKKYYFSVKEGDPIFFEKKPLTLTRFLTKKIYRLILGNRIHNIKFENYVPSKADVYYWSIPVFFLNKLEFRGTLNHRTPTLAKDYLTYRYGNWTVPNKNWNFMTDDPTIKKSNSDEITNISEKYWK